MFNRVVIKIGSSTLTNGTERLFLPNIAELVRQCAALHATGKEVILCSSGAIAAGKGRLNFKRMPESLAEKQMLAAVGQSQLMRTWEQLFDIYSIHVGQILLTRSDFEKRNRFLNARDTLHALIQHKIVPIINENDAVTTEEIRVGDNDNLSAHVAVLAEADLLIMLTDQAGLYTHDPRTHPDAELIEEVSDIDDDLKEIAGGSGTTQGTGGMSTKLAAADIARRAGTRVVIAQGTSPNVITRIIDREEKIGTAFPALAHPVKNRRRWLLAASAIEGKIVVNQNAGKALCQPDGKSLLPAGIISIEGEFERGSTVEILTHDAKLLARGIARYRSHDLGRIAGQHSDKIESILGYGYGPAAVHRNDMVILK